MVFNNGKRFIWIPDTTWKTFEVICLENAVSSIEKDGKFAAG